MDMMIKNVKCVELNTRIVNAKYQRNFDEIFKKRLQIHTDFTNNIILISLFYCCKKMFTHTNVWMIGKIQ